MSRSRNGSFTAVIKSVHPTGSIALFQLVKSLSTIKSKALIFILFQGFLFGSSMVSVRYSIYQFKPTTFIWMRLTLSSLGSLSLYFFGKSRFHFPVDYRLWIHATMLGIFGTAIPLTAVATALQYQSSGITSVLLTLSPAITVILANFFLDDEKLSVRISIGVGLAFFGALLIALRNENGLTVPGKADPIGYELVLFAAIASSMATIYVRKYMRAYSTFNVNTIRIIIAALITLPVSLLIDGFDLKRVTVSGYFALGYSALIGTFLGYLIAFYNTKHFGATAIAMVSYVIPVVASLGGWIILKERISLGMLAGSGIIVAGIAIINKRN